MTREQGFLETILANPDDDGPRQIYADWLEENGDPERAEFIRVQIELARTPDGGSPRKKLAKREQFLLRENAQRWAEPLRGFVFSWQFARGFVEAVGVQHDPSAKGQGPSLPVRLAEVTRRVPLRALRIEGEFLDGPGLLEASPHLARFKSLEFPYGNFYGQNKHIRALLTAPHLAHLTRLYVMGDRNGYWLGKQTLCEIVNSPTLASLTDLTLCHDCEGLDRDVIRAIARSPRMAKLQRLNLEQSALPADVVRELATSPHLTRLAVLDLQYRKMERAAWQVLLEAPRFTGLRRLYLGGTTVIGAKGQWLGDLGETDFPEGSPENRDEALRDAFRNRFRPDVLDLMERQGLWYAGWFLFRE